MPVRASAIVPKSTNILRKALDDARKEANQIAREMQADFAKTCANWETEDKPKLASQVTETSDSFIAEATATGEVYGWVNYGTNPRGWESTGKIMKFQPGYTSRTQPGVVGSGSASRFGDVLYRRRIGTSLQGHSIKARHFDEAIAEKWSKSGGLADRMLAFLKRTFS